MDGHVHFAKPENGEDRSLGRDSCPWVNLDYRGKTLADLIREHPEYDGNRLILEIVGALRSLGFPPLPHVVEKLYRAKTGGEHPEKLVLLPIDYPKSPTPTHKEVMRLVEAFPDTIIGAVSVDPNREDAALRLYNKLSELAGLNERLRNGWRPVVKLDPLAQNFDPAKLGAGELGRMYSIMGDMGAVLVTHTGLLQTMMVRGDTEAADPARLMPVAERHPDLRIVLAHMGTPDMAAVNYWAGQGIMVRHFEHALEMVSRYPNVYGDMGGLLWTGDRPAGAYGECECRNYYFGDRAQFGFSRARDTLDKERRCLYRAGLRALGLGKKHLARKLIYGSDFPITGIDELKKQEGKLGGFNPAQNTARVFARA